MEVSVRLTTDAEKNDPSIPAFDYTKLTALNVCPRWGLVRYDLHKKMPFTGRQMALEMGGAAHQAFAAIRYFELLENVRANEGPRSDKWLQVVTQGRKQFGDDRWEGFKDIYKSNEDDRRKVIAIAHHMVNTSGFYDDPYDKRRTLSNLEASLIAYVDRLELGSRIPVVREGLVGIEVPFDLLIEFRHEESNDYDLRDPITTKIRYIGRMDGLVQAPYGIEVEENKTASRLDNSWQDSFLISHQVTGYCVAASAILGESVRDCTVRGMMVPLPKSYDLGGIVNVPISRTDGRIGEWYRWIYATITNLYLPYRSDPLEAPEFSHSCNRYFSSCSLIPLCSMETREDRLLTLEQMETDEWSPLHEETHRSAE